MENCIKSKIWWIEEGHRIEIHDVDSLKFEVIQFLLECTILIFLI